MLQAVTLTIALAAAPQLRTYEAQADGFSVSLPGTPKVETETEQGDDGPSTTRTYTLDTDDGIYVISALDDASMESATDEASVKAIFEGFKGSSTGDDKLVSTRKIALGKYPGREYRTRGKDLDTLSRVFLAGRHLYALMVGWHKGSSEKAVGAQQVLDSFQLLGAGKGAGKPLAAAFSCSIIGKDDKSTALKTTGTARISGKYIYCSATSKDERLLGGTGVITPSWHKLVAGAAKAFTGPDVRGEPNSEGHEYTYMFSLDPDRHWAECATDLTLALKVDGAGGARFEQALVFKQDCGGAAPRPAAAAPDPNREPVFAPGELEKLKQLKPPGDSAAVAWASAFVTPDPDFVERNLAGAGVKAGKLTITRAKLKQGDLRALTGIRPLFGCEDPKTDTTCRWDKWHVEVKGPKEFWLYNTDDSFYGPYRALVFTKTPDAWQWLAVADLDLGEP